MDGLPLKDAWIGYPVAGPRGLIALGVHGRRRCDTGAGATCDPLGMTLGSGPTPERAVML